MTRLLATLCVTSFLASTAVGEAQPRYCGDRTAIIERLAEGYGESRQSIGLAANNAIMETFANLETGTWTVTVTMPSGLMCLVASGQAFELLMETVTNDEPL